jgi:uncharacterized protein
VETVVTAAPQVQWRLLDVQAHDTRLAQIAHRRRALPEHAEVERIAARLAGVEAQLVAARTAVGDIERELTRAENDVEQVRARAARDRARLDSGQGTAKDLQALQREVEALAHRQEALEEVQLEVMERHEAASARVDQVLTERETLTREQGQALARRESALAELESEEGGRRREREDAAAGLPDDLLRLYERVREQNGGIGAARLYQRRCEGCRLELTTVDITAIRTASPETVLRCEECGRILIRTAESGL